ncbi:MAG: sel1 repeat family protein, partial [Deltaproteobacteria bacterium]|nr:sel1 repeat family protein [Deltaproteobacteria bacterium]
EKGLGVRQDPGAAARWYRAAAEQQDPKALANLGALYASGKGVNTDYAEAARCFEAAVSRNDETAKVNLAVLYANGLGVDRSLLKAAQMFQRGSEQGIKQAVECLNRMKIGFMVSVVSIALIGMVFAGILLKLRRSREETIEQSE